MRNDEQAFAETRRSDALSASVPTKPWGAVHFENRLVDVRTVRMAVPPQTAFIPIQRTGGTTGWYYANWLRRLRGWMDLLVGG